MNVLLDWYEKNKRPLPWRKTSDPYKILLSEFILQQTRVNQGLKYYHSFLASYPTLNDLANASFDDIMRLWQGLGYYTRARNLWLSCREVAFERKGIFPSGFSELKKLKGVGDYTAAAVASIVFGEVVPVVDGNVFRVLSRYFAESEPIDTARGKKLFKELAFEVLDKSSPGIHNQAIMELGALVCTPTSPDCNACPLNESCQARIKGNYSDFPVKSAKTRQRVRYFYFYIYNIRGETIIQKRSGKDIWHGLYQFPLIETQRAISNESVLKKIPGLKLNKSDVISVLGISQPIRHILSHQIINTTFVHIQADRLNTDKNGDWLIVQSDSLEKYAFPRVITRYLENIR